MNKLSDNKIYSYIKACEKIVRNETKEHDKLVECERCGKWTTKADMISDDMCHDCSIPLFI